ncbi:hypothetical protein [Hymenobacter psoromatis]|uniref:hypothetical protein n=1 Tax=Hymenobacter psoromatis TaxID=1484116 RepID=UPI001CC0B16F|nr:hypothetical protein [Hymenobacter psoromatis]
MNIPLLNRLAQFGKPSPALTEASTRAQATVDAVCLALPEVLAVAVIAIESGQALASYAALPSLNPAKAALYNAEVVKQKRQAIKALGLNGEKIEDILITLREQLHLLRLSPDEQRLLYLAVSARDTNLAIARDVLKTYCQ